MPVASPANDGPKPKNPDLGLKLEGLNLSGFINVSQPSVEKPAFVYQIPERPYKAKVEAFIELSLAKNFAVEKTLQELIDQYQDHEAFFDSMTQILVKRQEPFLSQSACASLVLLYIKNPLQGVSVVATLSQISSEKVLDDTANIIKDSWYTKKYELVSDETLRREVLLVERYVSRFYELVPNNTLSWFKFDLIRTVLDRSADPAHDLLFFDIKEMAPSAITPASLTAYYSAGHKYISHFDYFLASQPVSPYESYKAKLTDRQLAILELFACSENYPEHSLQKKIAAEVVNVPNKLWEPLTDLARTFLAEDLNFEYFILPLRLATSFGRENPELLEAFQVLNNYRGQDLIVGVLLLDDIVKGNPEQLAVFIPMLREGKLKELESELYRQRLIEHQAKHPEKPISEVRRAYETKEFQESEVASVAALDLAFSKYTKIENMSPELAMASGPDINIRLKGLIASDLSRSEPDRFQTEFLALARELFKRQFGVYPYNTQVIAVLLMNDPNMQGQQASEFANSISKGVYAQIKTGEGKSLIFALNAALQAAQGHKVDVITSNCYLADRDALRFETYFEQMGITCGSFSIKSSKSSQVEGQPAQILYSTNQDLIFHYLSSRLNNQDFFGNNRFDVVLVDEADNLCLDLTTESCRISSPSQATYNKADLETFIKFVDLYGHKAVRESLVEAVVEFHIRNPSVHKENDILTGIYLLSAVHSAEVEQNRNFIIKDEKVMIVDFGNTGRIKDNHRWSSGLHEFVALRHGLPLPEHQAVSALMSHANFIRRYKTVQCISGTFGDQIDRHEIQDLYGLRGFDVPPHHQSEREDYPVTLMLSKEQWINSIINSVQYYTEQDRPLLIFSSTIAESREIYQRLCQLGLKVQLLNDSDNFDVDGNSISEELIINRAGAAKMITVATDVAGRGADIVPTEEAIAAGGLHVIITALLNNKRVEYQARGRAGRQGRPGSSEIIVCAEQDRIIKSLHPDIQKVIADVATTYGSDSIEVQRLLSFLTTARNIFGSVYRRAMMNTEDIAELAMHNYFEHSNKLVTMLEQSNNTIRQNRARGLGGMLVSLYMHEHWSQSFENFNISLAHLSNSQSTAEQVGISSVQELKSITTLAAVFKQTFGIDIFDPSTASITEPLPRVMLSIFSYYLNQIFEQEIRVRSINYEKFQLMLEDLDSQVAQLTSECFGYFNEASVDQIKAFLEQKTPKKDDPSLN